MKEIEDFNQIIENYYKRNGIDIVFKFLHVVVPYTYIDMHYKYIDGNDGFKEKERIERIDRDDLVFVPIITSHEYYDKKFKGRIYDYDMKPLKIENRIDIGTSDEFNKEKLWEKIIDIIPKECTIIDDSILTAIANEQGYDQFAWNIYDAAVLKPSIAYCGPEWTYKIYGINNLLISEGKKLI